MTVTRDQTATGQTGNASSVTLTWPTSPTAGSKAIVVVQTEGTVSTVKDNGAVQSTFTQDQLFTGPGGDLCVYRADGIHLPSSGSYTVTITFGAADPFAASGRTYLGVATGAPASTNDNTGTSTTETTGNVTPSASGSLIVGGFANDSGLDPETITLTTSGASALYTNDNGNDLCGGAADIIPANTTSQGLTWTTGDSVDWAAHVVVYSPASGTSHTATASLTVTPSRTATGTHAHFRTGSLTVTPARTAAPRHAHFRTASLSAAPSLTAVSHHVHTRSASLTVTPTRTASATRSHHRTASLAVNPSLAAAGHRGHSRTASLTVTPDFEAASGSIPHTRAASLTVTPSATATAHRGHARAASLTVTPSRAATHSQAHARSASLTVDVTTTASNTAIWPDTYTTNFNPNPSLESGIAGYAGLTGDERISQDTVAWTGRYGLKVTTFGLVPGEGVITPAGSVIASVTGSASLYIYGDTGNLTVAAVQTGGQVIGSIPVQPDPGGWQRVALDQLAMTGGSELRLMVYTTTAQPLTFWIDAVQYEPETPAHPYVDGDQSYAAWTATLPPSPSYQLFQNPTSASGGMTLEGSLGVTAHGAVFSAGKVAGQMDMSGQQFPMCAVSSPDREVISPAIDPGVPGLPWEISGGGTISAVTVLSPGPAFTDFSVYETGTDPDPAMTLIGASNAGIENASNSTGSYTQVYASFSPPQQSLDSRGNARWQAAAYMAAGFAVSAQGAWSSGNPNGVNFTQVQVEKATGATPGAYQRPRALSTIIKPTSMNYVTNPSVEVSTSGWTAVSGATLTRVSGGYQGSYSLQVSVPSAGAGASIEVPLLILGDTFTASAYLSPVSANIADIAMDVGGASTSANPTGWPYGAGDYGSGPYGGVNAASAPMATGGWDYRPWTPFTAPASTVTLTLTPVAITGATYPLVFDIDCVMITPGEVLAAYGDGSTDQWQWELGGTPGLSRSYYYERENVGANAVQSVLSMHIPLGLTAYAPQYAVPPTQ